MSEDSVMIIAIDGPSGAGKGTICRLLAQKKQFHLLDSGALYRLTALAAMQANVDLYNEDGVTRVASNLDVRFDASDTHVSIILAGEDVSQRIRQEDVGMNASIVAACQPVRAALLARQRAFAKAPGLVADGRDMGTVVFPGAQVKIFLTATAEERARRRYLQLADAGEKADLANILADIEARDLRDSSRAVAPLKPAADAIVLDSTTLNVDQVLERILSIVDC